MRNGVRIWFFAMFGGIGLIHLTLFITQELEPALVICCALNKKASLNSAYVFLV